MNVETPTRKYFYKTLFAAGIAALLFLGLYRQPYYPVSWFDEGLVMQGATNLVKHGQYAMLSVEGFRVLDQPLIANGPGIILPLSAVFTFFGIGLLQARILMAGYFVLAAILFFVITSRLYGNIAAVISMFILLAIPAEGFILYGRQALGNVPGLAYFFSGCWFFIKLGDGKMIRHAFASGLFFGLALVTKGQYWLLIPALGLVIAADWFYYKQFGLVNGSVLLGTIIACLGIWQLSQFVLVGAENYGQHLEVIRSSSRVTVFAFQLIRFPYSVWYLLQSGFLIFIVPGVLFAARQTHSRDGQGITRLFLVCLVVSWVIWFTVASVGWNRYAFEAYSIGAIFSGAGFLEMIKWIRKPANEFASKSQGFLKLCLVSFLAVILFLGSQNFYKQLQLVFFHRNNSPQLFADYLKTNIPANEVIESWEWEIDALAPEMTYHHPTNDWVDKKTAEIHFGDKTIDVYDPLAYKPGYLVDGPFSKSTGLYQAFLSDGCCVQVVSVGDYTLYQVIINDN